MVAEEIDIDSAVITHKISTLVDGDAEGSRCLVGW
jgi:hypothetical protein